MDSVIMPDFQSSAGHRSSNNEMSSLDRSRNLEINDYVYADNSTLTPVPSRTWPQQSQSQSETQTQKAAMDSDMTANLLAVAWVIAFIYCCICGRSRVPGPEHWRGAQMRRQYQEFLARERAKEERDNQSPEYRHALVSHNMRTKVREVEGFPRVIRLSSSSDTHYSRSPFPLRRSSRFIAFFSSESHFKRCQRKLDTGKSRRGGAPPTSHYYCCDDDDISLVTCNHRPSTARRRTTARRSTTRAAGNTGSSTGIGF
jgi:hypothetical protein